MLRIITHIERLLLTHDCVILPKFGGFVLQTLPATYQEEEHLFRPMRKEVMFNVTLQHTDGLLSESYMQTYGVDYRKAQLMLEEDIEALNVSLEQDKRITLGRIGTFSIGEEAILDVFLEINGEFSFLTNIVLPPRTIKKDLFDIISTGIESVFV